VPVSSYELLAEREALAGELSTVSGYLVSTRTIGKNTCFKVLADQAAREWKRRRARALKLLPRAPLPHRSNLARRRKRDRSRIYARSLRERRRSCRATLRHTEGARRP
jgi:hypothetical protein